MRRCRYLTIYTYSFVCLFVCLFVPYAIYTTARNGSKRSVPTDEALRHVCTGLACDYLPCGKRLLCNFGWGDLESILLHVIGRRLPQIIRWLGCVVRMSKHLAFFHSFMSKFNLRAYIMCIHLPNTYTS